MKSILIFALKVVVSIGSLYIVSRSIAWTEVGNVIKHAQYSLIIFALAVFLAAQIFSALRCVYIARKLRGSLDFSTSLRAHFVGLWFNQVLPTTLGGDIIKTAILKKPLGLSIAIRSVILDRISGLVFLLLAILLTLPLYVYFFQAYLELVIALGLIAVGGGVAITIGAWTAHRITKLTVLNPVFIKLIQIFSDVWAFRKGIFLWEQAWTSAIIHFNGIVTYVLLGFALGVNVSLITFLLVVPVIFLIALIPISFAGWGLREVGAVWMFGMVDINNHNALAMSVCFGMLLVIAGLPGLFIFLYQSLIKRMRN